VTVGKRKGCYWKGKKVPFFGQFGRGKKAHLNKGGKEDTNCNIRKADSNNNIKRRRRKRKGGDILTGGS